MAHALDNHHVTLDRVSAAIVEAGNRDMVDDMIDFMDTVDEAIWRQEERERQARNKLNLTRTT